MTRYRLRTIVAAGASAVAAAAVAALPASPAAAGPVSCPGGGGTCDIGLYQQVTLGGDAGGSGSAAPIALPTPPCWYEKYASPTTLAQDTLTLRGPGETLENPDSAIGKQILKRANATYSPVKGVQFHGTPQAGTWYTVQSANGWTTACNNLPLYQFVAPGQPVPVPANVPPVDLADYAANHQTIPLPGAIVSPAKETYVTFPTYVWGHWAASPTTGRMSAYKTTATLGNETVTVWSYPARLTVGAGGPAKLASPCGPTGSAAPVGRPPATKPGTLPDCGLLPLAPANALGITATVTWTRTWGVGNLNAPGPNALPSATVTGPPTTLPVAQIQNINNR